jgi:hypothetical protein
MIQISYAESLQKPLRLLEFEDLHALSEWMETIPSVSTKEDSPIITTAIFPKYPVPATKRTYDRATHTTGAILDFDSGDVTAEEVAAEFDAENIPYLIRTTFSSTPEHPRFFAFVPWSIACPVGDHRRSIQNAIKPKLNGHGSFAPESLNAVQPRFCAKRANVPADIYLPDGEPWMLVPPTPTLSQQQPAASPPSAFDSLELDPKARQLFRLALNYIDADESRETWVSVLGCGLRMFGITHEKLRSRALSKEQWELVALLEDFSSRGSKRKYYSPENGRGIASCTATRVNAEGDNVPSMVMQNARRVLDGTHQITLTGVIKRTDFPAFEAMLEEQFPELLEQARSRHGAPVVPQAVVTEKELGKARTKAEVALSQYEAELEEYRRKVDTLFDTMPEGPAMKLAMGLASGGLTNQSEWFLPPVAAIVLASQIINVVIANRVFVQVGNLPPLSGNTYAYLFNDSGTGKSLQLNYAMEILNRAGYGHARYPGKVHSASGVHTVLLQRGPTIILATDEVKQWFSGIVGTQTNGNQQTLDAFMLEAFQASCRGKSITPDARAADRRGNEVQAALPIRQPNISTFMVGVPADMNAFTESMFSDGSLARAMCFTPMRMMSEETYDRGRRLAERRGELRSGKLTDGEDKVRVDAVQALKLLDAKLDQQGLGSDLAKVLAAEAFEEELVPENEIIQFRDFSRARANFPDNMVRILTLEPRTLELINARDIEFGTKWPHKELESCVARYVEKALKIALSLSVINDPTCTVINHDMVKFTLDLVELVETPWFIRSTRNELGIELGYNKFSRLAQEIKGMLVKGGVLHRATNGMTVREIRRTKGMYPLYKVVQQHLTSVSPTMRNDASTLLEALDLVPVRSEGQKGFRIYHPDHRPEITHDDEEE